MASGIMESFFQRSLEDLVKGLRVQMIGEARYLAKALEEIRKEIKSTEGQTKTVALQKLTYLNMLQGIDMEWAAFHVVEVMSMPRFAQKKIGYLAASQSFHEGIDVLLLITNQLRKDLTSASEYEASLALECISRIATPDLSRDLTPEIFTMLSSSRLPVRKRATLVLLKIFAKYPDAVKIAFKRLVEKMEDPDPQVICAAVSVLCEMATKDPKAYLPLAPEFYRLLMDSTNNWLLIKVVKIFGILAPIEPRLGRKIVEPICEHMRRTGAKSLLLECIRTVILGLTDHIGAVKLAVEKLKEFLAEDDPNLKYLGLEALATLMPSHPWAVTENKEIIVTSLSDRDPSIQMASLRLIMGMVSESNIMETVEILKSFAQETDPDFCNDIINSILATCSRDLYELIPDFTWYVSILGEIARIPHSNHAKEVERQFIDIGMRVKDVRPDLVRVARGLLLDSALLGQLSLHSVLSAAAWIAGEYVDFSHNPHELVEALLQPRTRLLPPPVRAVYLQAVLKVFLFSAFECLKSAEDCNEGPTPHVSVDASSSIALVTETKKLLQTESETKLGSNVSGGRGEEEGLVEHYAEVTSNVGQLCSKSIMAMNSIQESTIREDIVYHSKSVSEKQGKESLAKLMELIRLNVSSLAESVDVEVQERACNILGLLRALEEQEILRDGEPIGLIDVSDDRQYRLQSPIAFQMVNFMRGIFCQELGPVSSLAQGRVPIPVGLHLQESLNNLGLSFSDDEVAADKGQEWHFGTSQVREWEGGTTFLQRGKEDVSQSGESTSLLTLHRQLHGAYYLSTEKSPAKADEYPSPEIAYADTLLPSAGALNDMAKLAEKSLFSTKPRRPKPRPVVIRLDDTEETPIVPAKSKKDLKDDFISSAIREVLAGEKTKQLMGVEVSEKKQSTFHASSHRLHMRSHVSGRHCDGGSKEGTVGPHVGGALSSKQPDAKLTLEMADEIAEPDFGKQGKKTSGSRQMHFRQKKGDVAKGKQLEKDTDVPIQKQSGRRSRHRTRSPIKLSVQTPVIPDFLL